MKPILFSILICCVSSHVFAMEDRTNRPNIQRNDRVEQLIIATEGGQHTHNYNTYNQPNYSQGTSPENHILINGAIQVGNAGWQGLLQGITQGVGTAVAQTFINLLYQSPQDKINPEFEANLAHQMTIAQYAKTRSAITNTIKSFPEQNDNNRQLLLSHAKAYLSFLNQLCLVQYSLSDALPSITEETIQCARLLDKDEAQTVLVQNITNAHYDLIQKQNNIADNTKHSEKVDLTKAKFIFDQNR